MSKFSWKFIDNQGTFEVNNPRKCSHLYFPLANDAEFMSSISPNLNGDIKTGLNSFLLEPVSSIDLHNRHSSRNFWIYVDKNKVWSLAQGNDDVKLEAGLLWHKIISKNKKLGLAAQVLNFVPSSGEHVEIMQVTLTNISKRTVKFSATSAIPLYCRSADNLRDHRHVSSLLNRVALDKYGVVVKPIMTFDERGHKINYNSYFCLGLDKNGSAPISFFPVLDNFIGEGGNLDNPQAILENKPGQAKINSTDQGKECLGGLRFKSQTLKSNQSAQFIILLGIAEHKEQIKKILNKFNTGQKVERSLNETKLYWQNIANRISFLTGDFQLDNWLRWVNVQPALRKIYGCSFLPEFDYGRGGKGWRDLWQDCLALLLSGNVDIRPLLIRNFSGVRLDGTNATIITKNPPYFIADRNNIARVWMDHAVWPYFTLELYMHQTGDFDILLEKTGYFSDSEKKSTRRGTILEHILLQHLTQCSNLGKHGNIRLQGADWNDGLDMAQKRGESVAFTAFYARNLKNLAHIIQRLPHKKINLFNKNIPKENLVRDLLNKSELMFKRIRKNEWLKEGFFNGYYDENSRRVEGKHKLGTRMTLTGQVFPIMSGIATDEQIRKSFASAKKYLKDKNLGGFRLNNNFKELKMDLGRAFAFAFGEKENGAFFSHMDVMFAYALYTRGHAKEGFEVLNSIYNMAVDLEKGRIYPCMPEYFNSEGRGRYMYLTGSASWYIFTMLTQVFGVRGEEGNLVINPKLVAEQFNKKDEISISAYFAGKKINITYLNPKKLSYPNYEIKDVISSSKIPYSLQDKQTISFSRNNLTSNLTLNIIFS